MFLPCVTKNQTGKRTKIEMIRKSIKKTKKRIYVKIKTIQFDLIYFLFISLKIIIFH